MSLLVNKTDAEGVQISQTKAPAVAGTDITIYLPEDSVATDSLIVFGYESSGDNPANVLIYDSFIHSTNSSLFDITGNKLTYTPGANPDALDFEAETPTEYTFTLDVWLYTADWSFFDISLTYNVTVRISDVDEVPTGIDITPVRADLAEGIYMEGMKLADVTIIDDALGTNTLATFAADSVFEYRNIDGNAAELWLKNGAELDYETMDELTASLNATSTGFEDSSVMGEFKLAVTDVDEAPSEVEVTSISGVQIREGVQAVATHVANIEIIDDALGTNTLTPLDDNRNFEYRNVNGNSAELWISQGAEFDYETSAQVSLNIGVRAAGIDDAPDDAIFSLDIKDVDEKPTGVTIVRTDVTSIDENSRIATHVANLTIDDDALGTNSFASLSSSGHFEYRNINGNTAELWLKDGQDINYETLLGNKNLSIDINVGGSGIGTNPNATTFELPVNNVNEAHYFADARDMEVSEYTASVDENSTDFTTTVKIFDPDNMVTVLYKKPLDPAENTSNELFSIDALTGEITLRSPLDYEVDNGHGQGVYKFDVNAIIIDRFGGTPMLPPLTESVIVTVRARDIDEAPTGITITPTAITSIEENRQTAAHVADITIVDDALGVNTLNALDESSLFEYRYINDNEAELWLKAGQDIDYDTLPDNKNISINIGATGSGRMREFEPATFTLAVSDVNEGAIPVDEDGTTIIPSYRASILENTAIGSMFFTLKAIDPEGTARLTYRIEGSDAGPFSVSTVPSPSPATGLITLNSELNYETKNQYIIDVVITSIDIMQGQRPDIKVTNTTLTIDVENIIEAGITEVFNKPFVPESETPSEEDRRVGKFVLPEGASVTIKNNDVQKSSSSEFEYRNGYLVVTSVDALNTATTYELFANVTGGDSFSFSVKMNTVVPEGVILATIFESGIATVPSSRLNVEPDEDSLTFVDRPVAVLVYDDDDDNMVIGSYHVTKGVLEFTPNAGFAESVTFSAEVRDEHGARANQDVTINVRPAFDISSAYLQAREDTPWVDANGKIVAVDDLASGTISYTLIDNDTLDANGDHTENTASAALATATEPSSAKGRYGTLSVNADGTWSYRLNDGTDDTPNDPDTEALHGRKGEDGNIGTESVAVTLTHTPEGGAAETYTRTFTIEIEGLTDITYGDSNFPTYPANENFTQNLSLHDNGESLSPSSAFKYFYGGSGDDTIRGSDLNRNSLYGDGGDDTLYGGAGSDWLQGGSGNDTLYGGADIDWLWGGDGNDTLYGGAGSDFLLSWTGNDTFSGGAGRDVLWGDYHGDGYQDTFVLNQDDGLTDADVDIVIDFSRREVADKIRVDTSSGNETTLDALKSAANIRWAIVDDYEDATTGYDNYNDTDIDDTIIYNKGLLADTSDDVMLMVLEDYVAPLTIDNFDIV